MNWLPLTRGKIVIIDEDDYDELVQFSWHATRVKYGLAGYQFVAVRTCYCPFDNKKKRTIFMHRQITSCPRGLQVDHINHEPLDNRKVNLRVCTGTENMHNSHAHKLSSSQYKGVSWYPPTKTWQAHIRVDKKKLHLGYFENEQDAAKAYDEAASKEFQSFALLNF